MQSFLSSVNYAALIGGALTTLLGTPCLGQTQALDISLANGSERERQTQQQLERLMTEYDVERWLFTREVVIDQTQIPHSHPVLTLHTRHLGDDHHLLATFVHEQFHWYVSDNDDAERNAIAAFREEFRDVPAGGPEGARDEHSTYLHLIVCDLEYQAMIHLVGAGRARQVMESTTHYTWIYDRVVNDGSVREINHRNGFNVMEIAADSR